MTLLITGPGRAGTTALTQLCGALGYRLGDASQVDPVSRAGLESEVDNVDAEVIKNPRLSFSLGDADAAHVDAVLVAMRSADQIVASRVRAALAHDRLRGPGGFAGARTIRGQRQLTVAAVYEIALDCARLDLPVAFIAFPRFTRDVDYCFRVLDRLPLPRPLERPAFDVAWRETMRPAHDDPGPLSPSERARTLGLQVKDLWVDVWKRGHPLRP